MRNILRIFMQLMVPALFFLSMQAGAETLPIAAAGESGAGSRGEQLVVPGYFQPKSAEAKTLSADPETNAMLWPLLLGGVGLGLFFFWMGRRSRTSSLPLEAPRRVVPAPRDSHEGKDEGDETKYWVPLEQATMVTVDELTSVEEEAEVFLLLGRMDMAIGVLRHHVESHASAPAHVWMSLLDVLHAQGLRQEFEKLALEISERFNVALPTWEDANARSHDLTGLEHFPHLLDRIMMRWNKSDCLAYLHDLTQDNRNGERGGFSLDAFREILILIGVLENKQKMVA